MHWLSITGASLCLFFSACFLQLDLAICVDAQPEAAGIKTPETPTPQGGSPQAQRGDHYSASSEDPQQGQGQQLGEDEQGLRQAPPEEIKRRMAHLVEEYVDSDKDGFVSIEELRDWVKGIHEAMTLDNVEQQWSYYKAVDAREDGSAGSWEGYRSDDKQALSWEKYKQLTYPEEEKGDTLPGNMSQKEMLARAERRWKLADVDADGKLSKDEFHAFLHPDEFDRMKDVLVTEATEDMDKDNNKDVSLEEYMDYMGKMAGPEKVDPQWGPAQQNQFTSYLDKNKDGALNTLEMKEWILPPYDRSDAEAWRMMSAADTDQDNKISKDDILNQYQFFLVLQPPEFWAVAENKTHDEF